MQMNNHLIIIIDIGLSYGEPFRESVIHYAKRCGADVLLITNYDTSEFVSGEPHWTLLGLIRDYANGSYDRYDRILILDLDVYIMEDAPNIFDSVPQSLAAVEDFQGRPEYKEHFKKWCKEYYEYEPESDLYFNTGLLLLTKPWAQHISEKFSGPYHSYWFEQHYLNYIFQRYGCMPDPIDFTWNWQIMTKHPDTSVKFLHCNGVQGYEKISTLQALLKDATPVERELPSVNVCVPRRKFLILYEAFGQWGQKVVDHIVKLAWPEREIVWQMDPDPRQPFDLLVASHFERENPPRVPRDIEIPYVLFGTESSPVAYRPRDYDPLFNFSSTETPGCIHMPFGVVADFHWPDVRICSSMDRPHLVAYCTSNQGNNLRNQLYLRFHHRVPNQAHAIGNTLNSNAKVRMGDATKAEVDTLPIVQLHRFPPATGYFNQLHHYYHNYHFTINCENVSVPGYMTEKIFTGFRAGAIPIYWGAAEYARRIFNHEAFINVHDFDNNLDAVVDEVFRILADRNRLEAMKKAPVFKDNKPPDFLQAWNPNYKDEPCAFYDDLALKLREATEATMQ